VKGTIEGALQRKIGLDRDPTHQGKQRRALLEGI
jgi:hypothetical protein